MDTSTRSYIWCFSMLLDGLVKWLSCFLLTLLCLLLIVLDSRSVVSSSLFCSVYASQSDCRSVSLSVCYRVHSDDSTKCFAFSSVWCAQVAAAFACLLLSVLVKSQSDSLFESTPIDSTRLGFIYNQADEGGRWSGGWALGTHTNHTKPNTSRQQ